PPADEFVPKIPQMRHRPAKRGQPQLQERPKHRPHATHAHPPLFAPGLCTPHDELTTLRAAPPGKSLQWSDLRREGDESYARMTASARPRPTHGATPLPLRERDSFSASSRKAG